MILQLGDVTDACVVSVPATPYRDATTRSTRPSASTVTRTIGAGAGGPSPGGFRNV